MNTMDRAAGRGGVMFDERNLRDGEVIMHTFKPYKRSYMVRNFFMGGGIPFPFVLLWGIIDFGVLAGVTCAAIFADNFPAAMLFFLYPFIAIHAAPVWIWLYGVIKGIKNYKMCGHIVTNQRIITRMDTKSPFRDIQFSKMNSITILSNKPNNASLHFDDDSADDNKDLTLYSLSIDDAEYVVDLFHKVRDENKKAQFDQTFGNECENCGGRLVGGRCIYCGAIAGTLNMTMKATKRK